MNIDELQKNNPTELCEIMSRFGSDKGNHHNYTKIYHFLFNSIRYDTLNIFELGIGPINVGASHKGWKNFFPNSFVYGADKNRRLLFNEDRIKTYFCDQTDPKTIKEMWDLVGDILFDIIVDDGLHTQNANTCFLQNSIHKLKKDGIYIIEDVLHPDPFEKWLKDNDYNYEILKLTKEKTSDNNLILIRK